jgi:putative tryptophan/tyrosine transport system substrate-binding protein
MRRRQFITLGGAAASSSLLWARGAHAQPGGRVRRVGILNQFAEDDPDGVRLIAAFQQRLQDLGWTVGRNLRIDQRFGVGDVARYRVYAAELVGLAPDVMLASNSTILQALVQRTHTIPIVFYQVTDPVTDGFVASLARPGGNVTGFANNEFSMSGKWLELLKDIAPGVNRAMVVLDPENPTWRGYFRTIEAVAPALSMEITPTPVIDLAGIERAVEAFAREPNGGLVVLPGPATTGRAALIAGLAVRYRLPGVYPTSGVRNGGLLSYGVDLFDQIRKAAGYVDRVLKGEKPADLPVQQPTKFNLIVNLKAAKAIGLTIPETFLVRADEVIE